MWLAAGALGAFGAAIVIMWGVYARFGAEAGDHPPLRGTMRPFALLPQPAPLPEIAFVDRDQTPRSLADFRGKVVLLNLWATWCAPCIKEMPSLERLQATLAGPDFTVLALSLDRGGLPLVQKFYGEVGLTLDMYIDKTTSAGRTLKARGLPTSVLIDAEGREIGRLEGAAEWDAPEALALMRHYLPKRAPATTSTRAPARDAPAG